MNDKDGVSMFEKAKRLLLGGPRDIRDPQVYHRISLVALLAWVGLGADGLSSSCYGPEESFKILGEHTYLAVLLALGIVATVFIISYAYSRVIEHFPFGGGGYTVATRLLGPKYGLVSGGALLHDYFLTITISIASGIDALFSLLPPHWQPWKVPAAAAAIVLMTVLNLRGVRESILVLAPIFGLFVVTHLVLIFGAFFVNAGELPRVAAEVHAGFRSGLATLGFFGMAALFLRAYAMGAGTYTGIEAVSNGLQIMREPKVETGKRTMVLMASSLAFTAGGIILGYLLVHARPMDGQTMNAVLTRALVDHLGLGGAWSGRAFIAATLFAEAMLLVIAAQAGFMDGPRIMANMAHDSWLPRRFGSLSDRLTVQDGVLVMAGASLLLLFHTRGDVGRLVVMYSINVFLTFSLTEASMIRFWLKERASHADWKRKISVHVTGFVICLSMLILNLVMKFAEGGWETVVITGAIIGSCLLIRRHYDAVQEGLTRLNDVLGSLPAEPGAVAPALDPKAPTAILLVGGYTGLGVHSLLSVQRLFPGHFKNFVFVSVGVIDSATFKGVEAVDELRRSTELSLRRYVQLARSWGLAADYRLSLSTEVSSEAEKLCRETAAEFPRSVVFAGKLVFQRRRWFDRFLHNETAYEIQRRLQFAGLNAMVLPVRVMAGAAVLFALLAAPTPARAAEVSTDAWKSRVESLERRLDELERGKTRVEAAPASSEASAPQPFDFADFTWLNGNSRLKSSPLDGKYFTGQVMADVNYVYSFNRPADHTLTGSCETGRSNEFQLQQLGVGGDLHYENVRGRLMTQFGLYSQMTPRNDATPSRGQWKLDDAYRQLSEAYGGYHWDALQGVNLDAGLFMSYVGLFSYYQNENWAYQPSYVSANTPWFFNGLRLQVFPTDRLKIEGWLVNGWQSYGKFNDDPGLGTQILWRPNGRVSVLSNDYWGHDTLGGARRQRWHTDNSLQVKYYDDPSRLLDKAAFSLTIDAGCEEGGGVSCAGSHGAPKQDFLGFMVYSRTWFKKDLFGLTLGGGAITNPGRYLVLLPPINGATAASGTPYFTMNPGDSYRAWDGSATFDYMPSQFLTWRLEYNHREASVPYFAGRGGITPPGGNQGAPGSAAPGFAPDLRRAENRMTLALLLRM